MKHFIPALACMTAFAGPAPALADAIDLVQGQRLDGVITGFDGTNWSIQVPGTGLLQVPENQVARLVTDRPMTLTDNRGNSYQAQFIDGLPGVHVVAMGPVTLQVSAESITRASLLPGATARAPDSMNAVQVGMPVSEAVAESTPPPMDEPATAPDEPAAEPAGKKWSGRAALGISIDDGNSDSTQIDFNGDAMLEFPDDDRLRLEGEIDYEEANQTTVDEYYRALAAWDHFWTARFFTTAETAFEREEPAGIDLRTSFALLAGYKVFDDDTTQLEVKAGLSHTEEAFNTTTPDRDFQALTWRVNFEHKLWDAALVLYHDQRGETDLTDEAGATEIDTDTGARVPLLGDVVSGLSAETGIELDFDSDPAGNASKTDRTWYLRVGYEFGG